MFKKTYENLTCSNSYNRKVHVQNGGCSMAIRVGCLKSDAPVFQGNEKRVVVQFADLAAWAKDAEKKELVGETRMGKWMECVKRW